MKVISDENFNQTLTDNADVLVQFSAPWCGPCKALTATLSETARDNPDVTIVKVDIEQSPATAAAFQIRSVPTLIYFKNGSEVKKTIGAKSANKLQDFVNECK